MRHGWRYGANIMRANGLGVPSRERGISYLKKVMARDSRIGMMKTAGDKKFSKIHGLRNQHDEYARRTRTGSRKYNYRKDPNKGKMLTDLDPRGRAMAKTVARNMELVKSGLKNLRNSLTKKVLKQTRPTGNSESAEWLIPLRTICQKMRLALYLGDW